LIAAHQPRRKLYLAADYIEFSDDYEENYALNNSEEKMDE
jgi:hypothetical protein